VVVNYSTVRTVLKFYLSFNRLKSRAHIYNVLISEIIAKNCPNRCYLKAATLPVTRLTADKL
jgi:hypothetical protein